MYGRRGWFSAFIGKIVILKLGESIVNARLWCIVRKNGTSSHDQRENGEGHKNGEGHDQIPSKTANECGFR